jgi:hypothetical protein
VSFPKWQRVCFLGYLCVSIICACVQRCAGNSLAFLVGVVEPIGRCGVLVNQRECRYDGRWLRLIEHSRFDSHGVRSQVAGFCLPRVMAGAIRLEFVATRK